MAKFIVGDVVIVPFPFSDLTQTKRRPALVVASLSGEDLILCQITSTGRHNSRDYLFSGISLRLRSLSGVVRVAFP
jgi:PemK-like, MazF-like toxin of type II toxin-antitoxin system